MTFIKINQRSSLKVNTFAPTVCLMERDYSSISPSAKALLLMKGLTSIPFAHEAAMLWCGKDALNETQKRVDEEAFLLRLIHFENRYWSVSALLDEFGQSNVLEMSSGFSFRGLDKAIAAQNTVYTDTDLPDIVEMKKTLTRELLQRDGFDLRGKLFMQALNALDEAAFDQVLELFPPGPLTIVNEGLLVYLDEREKRHLLSIIHKVLKEKGGCWITGDVYIKTEREIGNAHDDFSDFLKKHNIDDNKFEDFGQAESFFNSCGFEVIKKIVTIPQKLTAARYLKPQTIAKFQKPEARVRMHETWAVKPM